MKKFTKLGRTFSSKRAMNEFEEIRSMLLESNEEAVLFDGLEDALIGIGTRFGADPVAVIDIFIQRDKMTREDAEEHFSYNVIGTGVEHSPIFVEIFRDASTKVR